MIFIVDPKYFEDLTGNYVILSNENVQLTNFNDIRELSLISPSASIIDITAIDNKIGVTTRRFKIVYLIRDTKHPEEALIWTHDVRDAEKVKTLSDVFDSAHALEREIYDMFGVFFSEHQDLRRLLTDYGFVGFPLRKDFPVTGYYEILRVHPNSTFQYERVALEQDYRTFV